MKCGFITTFRYKTKHFSWRTCSEEGKNSSNSGSLNFLEFTREILVYLEKWSKNSIMSIGSIILWTDPKLTPLGKEKHSFSSWQYTNSHIYDCHIQNCLITLQTTSHLPYYLALVHCNFIARWVKTCFEPEGHCWNKCQFWKVREIIFFGRLIFVEQIVYKWLSKNKSNCGKNKLLF